MINVEQCAGLTGLRSSGAVGGWGVEGRNKGLPAGGQGRTKGQIKGVLGS